MSNQHVGRYVRRVPHVEPPVEPPVEERCDRHRRHIVRRNTPHDGRSGRRTTRHPADRWTATPPPAAPTVEVESDNHMDPLVIRFADSSLRLVLEAVDGRRPTAQLTTVLDRRLVPTVAAARTSRSGDGTAVLLRTRLRAVDPDTVEMFGSYARGQRVFAVAGRLVRTGGRGRSPRRWAIKTLWLG